LSAALSPLFILFARVYFGSLPGMPQNHAERFRRVRRSLSRLPRMF
jgi:hypothetical protein